jgi:hypothetical protein
VLRAAIEDLVTASAPPALRDLAALVGHMVCDGIAPSTFHSYDLAFTKYAGFAADCGVPALPAVPHVVSCFLAAQLGTRQTLGTVTATLAAINFATKATGSPPLEQGQFALIRAAARRRFTKAVKRSAELTPELVAQLARSMLNDEADEATAKLGICMVWSFMAGARFSDLDRTNIDDIEVCGAGLVVTPSRRKNNDAAARVSPNLRDLFVAAVGGPTCAATAFLRLKQKFGWTGKLMTWSYGSYLRRLRLALVEHGGLTETEALSYGTHMGRRGAALACRRAGAGSREIRSFAGVIGEGWDDVYADSVIPEERAAVGHALAVEVAAAA